MKKYLFFIITILLVSSCFEIEVEKEVEKTCDLKCKETEQCEFFIGKATCIEKAINSNWSDLTSYEGYSCAINRTPDKDGKSIDILYCWGDPKFSDFRNEVTVLPTIKNNLHWSAVSNNDSYGCGISEGKLYCWGGNYNYRYGLRDQEDIYYDEPKLITSDEDWKKVSSGSHIFASKENGDLYCWGAYQDRTMGFGDDTGIPSLTSKDIKDFSFGKGSACMIDKNNDLYCWGDNHYGVLGTGDLALREVQTLIGSDWEKIVTSYHKSCGIKTDGSLYCWGQGSTSYLFEGKEDILTPTKIGVKNDWKKIFVSLNYGCAIDSKSELYCWGENSVGELGLGDYKVRSEPTKLDGTWKEIAGGRYHLCGIKTDGSLYCWGTNTYGQLGIGVKDEVSVNYNTPQRVIIR